MGFTSYKRGQEDSCIRWCNNFRNFGVFVPWYQGAPSELEGFIPEAQHKWGLRQNLFWDYCTAKGMVQVLADLTHLGVQIQKVVIPTTLPEDDTDRVQVLKYCTEHNIPLHF